MHGRLAHARSCIWRVHLCLDLRIEEQLGCGFKWRGRVERFAWIGHSIVCVERSRSILTRHSIACAYRKKGENDGTSRRYSGTCQSLLAKRVWMRPCAGGWEVNNDVHAATCTCRQSKSSVALVGMEKRAAANTVLEFISRARAFPSQRSRELARVFTSRRSVEYGCLCARACARACVRVCVCVWSRQNSRARAARCTTTTDAKTWHARLQSYAHTQRGSCLSHRCEQGLRTESCACAVHAPWTARAASGRDTRANWPSLRRPFLPLSQTAVCCCAAALCIPER
eukprot:IDg11692t1